MLMDEKTGAVIVTDKCIACGRCVETCPGKVPYINPEKKRALVCDLCSGDPECVKVCDWGALKLAKKRSYVEATCDAYAKDPSLIAKELRRTLYGDLI